MRNFHASTALITGASSGLGREMALQLSSEAATLIVAARRLDLLDTLKAEIHRQYPAVQVFPYQIDLSSSDEIGPFLEWLEKNHPQINLLINNAGVGDHGAFADGDWARAEKMIAVNISALTRITHSLLPRMLRNGAGGAILNVSSVASLLPIPHLNVYAATKAYVTSFSEGLRAELRGTNISVTALCPGPVPTEFSRHASRSSELNLQAPQIISVDTATAARVGLAAVLRDQARSVPGLPMFLIAAALTIAPIFLLRPFLNRFGLKQNKPR